MSRGGWRGGGRPAKPDSERRKHIGCRIHPDNYAWLESERERTGHSVGEIVDQAIETLQEHPEKQYPGQQEEAAQ